VNARGRSYIVGCACLKECGRTSFESHWERDRRAPIFRQNSMIILGVCVGEDEKKKKIIRTHLRIWIFYYPDGQVASWLPRWLIIISIKIEFFRLPRLSAQSLFGVFVNREPRSIIVITVIARLYLDIGLYYYY